MGSFCIEHRPDGSAVILHLRPVVIGSFPDAEMARKVMRLLEAEELGPVEVADVVLAPAVPAPVVPEAVAPPPVPKAAPEVVNLPAVVVSRPTAVARLSPAAAALTEEQKDSAFRRIAEGEKILTVAADFGLPWTVLRGMWAQHKSQMQRHLAEGGQIACTQCTRPFTPSLTHPDTCARCSHD
jgi:hypothetical protein